jgi:hypothetical protein
MRVRYDFIGDKVIYTSVIDGAAFQSIHNRAGMNEQEAMKAFHREHAREILILNQQRLQNESTSIA